MTKQEVNFHRHLSSVIKIMMYAMSGCAGVIILWKSLTLQQVLKFMVIKWITNIVLFDGSIPSDKAIDLKLNLLIEVLLIWYGDLTTTVITLYIFVTIIYAVIYFYTILRCDPIKTNQQEGNNIAKPKPFPRRLMDIKRYLGGKVSLKSPFFERDTQGWLKPKATLNVELEIAGIKGVIIDWNDGKCPLVKIIYKPTEKGNGLLSINDLQTMLQVDPGDIKSLTFSIDPVYEMVCCAASSLVLLLRTTVYQKRCNPAILADTAIMDTFFHSDYLLKFFTTGSEVSANFPFEVRSVKHLIQHLPEDLQSALRPPFLRESVQFVGAHRFWIEFEKAKVQQHVSDEKEFYIIDAVETKINTESLGSCPTMNGCKSFAEDFTAHYYKLSQYFPILARLDEIAKLQCIVRILHERLAAHGYKLQSSLSQEKDNGSPSPFVPSSFNEYFPVYGGVQMAPTYVKYPTPPEVHDSCTYKDIHDNGIPPITRSAQYAREGGIRMKAQVHSVLSNSIPPINFGFLLLDLASIATILKKV